MLGRVDTGAARLVSRHSVDWTDKFEPVSAALTSLSVKQVILDGEIAILAPDGTTRFSKLRGNHSPSDLLVYFVFDVLYLDGYDLRKAPLEDRKNVLANVLRGWSHPDHIQLVEHFDVGGPQLFEQVLAHGFEGVVSKRRRSQYVAGKSSAWVKTKNKEQAAFIICGYEHSSDNGFELLLGYHDDAGELVYAGRAGLGFTNVQREELGQRLPALRTEQCPFKTGRGRKRTVRWLEPTLVAVIEQGAWRGAGFLREAVYRGLRDDIPAASVSLADVEA